MRSRHFHLALLCSVATVLSGLTMGIPTAAAAANPAPPAANGASPAANPASPAYGHRYRHGVVPTVAQDHKMKASPAAQPPSCNYPMSTSNCRLSYGGGVDGIGVTSGPPKVYLVFWGSQWGTQGTDANGDLTFSNDYASGAPYLQRMFEGLGTDRELWSGTMTQYCDGAGVALHATSCPSSAPHVDYPAGGVLAGVWYDGTSKAPDPATGTQIGQEAVTAANHFGNTTAASNRYAQYVILSAPGTDPDSYQEQEFCAWHDYTNDPSLDGGSVNSPFDIAFTNMPYVMDAGSGCGEGFVNSPGTLDGYSIVAGHEYAETLTDQNPAGGWTNLTTGEEAADNCAWIPPGTAGGAANVTMSTGSFAMQAIWSNDTNSCAMSHSVVEPEVMTVVQGSGQTAAVTDAYSSPLEVNVSDQAGTPVAGVPVTFTAPSSGPSVTFASGCGSGSSATNCIETTDSNGNATTTGLTANKKAGMITVTVSAFPIASLPSFQLTSTAGPASQLAFSVQPPSSVQEDTGFNTAVTVQDQNGNVVNTDNNDVVALGISGDSSALSCTNQGGTSVTVSSGLASFTCSVSAPGANYQLEATSGSLTQASSTDFDVSAPTSTTASVTPSSAPYGQAVSYSANVTSSLLPLAGNVTFTAGSTTLCTATLSNGSGTCSASNAPMGSDPITASYGGDQTHSGSSGGASLTVGPNQIYGTTAIETAIAISQQEFQSPKSAQAVVLARSDFFSDALAGGPFAALKGAPLLITPGASQSSSLDPGVQAEIQRVLQPGGTVYILGGDLALSPNIDTTLEGFGYTVQRVYGQTEYGTAVAIAKAMGNPSVVFEATGLSFYDALSAVPAAIEQHAAILLTDGNQQDSETLAYLNQHPGDIRYAIGGKLAAWGADPNLPSKNAIWGQTLYDTSAEVASNFFPGAQMFGAATSQTFSDALAGSVFMATGGRRGPLLVVYPQPPLAPSAASYLGSLTPGSGEYVFGGPLAMPQNVVAALRAATG